MKKSSGTIVAVSGLALILAGCVSPMADPAQSKFHPANPQAAESPQQPAIPLLMAGAQALVPPLSTNQMEMQHEHNQQKPAGKGAQQPAEHKHEHEGKKEEKK